MSMVSGDFCEFSSMAPVVAFTIKPRVMDLDESNVYHELLCFSKTTPRHNWSTCSEEEVRVKNQSLYCLRVAASLSSILGATVV